MTLLVTGGTGFVLSHVVRQWLERHEEEEVVVVDRAGFDASAEVFFAPVRERIRLIRADAADTSSWTAGVDPMAPDSPMPLAPRGLLGVGVSIATNSNDGSSAEEIIE